MSAGSTARDDLHRMIDELSEDKIDTALRFLRSLWKAGSKELSEVVTVQISRAQELPYVSILVGGGRVSNVNTKPTEEALAAAVAHGCAKGG